MDLRVYSLNACRFLTGEEPVQIEASCSVTDRDGALRKRRRTWVGRCAFLRALPVAPAVMARIARIYACAGVKGIAEPEPAFCYQGISLKADIHGETPVEETNPAQGRSAICKQKPIIWPTAFSPQNSLRPAEKKAAAISSILANLYQAWRAYVVEPKNSLSRLSTGVATFT